jgi:hypothetical protein
MEFCLFLQSEDYLIRRGQSGSAVLNHGSLCKLMTHECGSYLLTFCYMFHFVLYLLTEDCCTLILNLRHELVFFKRTPYRANSKWRKRLWSRENFFHMAFGRSLSSDRHPVQIYKVYVAEVWREPNTIIWFQGCERAGFVSAPSPCIFTDGK